MNTGWSGGPYGVGSRMKLKYTRAMITAALNGTFDNAEYKHDEIFNVDVPQSCPEEMWIRDRGKESPFRSRSVEENLQLFEEMRAGRFADGEKVLRAKIDMASPNVNMRDPVIYRLSHADHHRTGSKWVIYPMYDFAHPLEDAYEGITHSICTLEFEAHRPLYDWVIENCECENVPHQYEFARLNLTRTIMSKR